MREYNQANYGVPCDLSTFLYPSPYPHPVPSGFKLLGYVLDVNVKFNNNVPMLIENVSVSSDLIGLLQTNSVKSTCATHCSYDVNVTLGSVTQPLGLSLTIDTELPLT